ncbi:MAG TPA: hypothetical protein VM681_11285 [Candidatus Thermoplasmatota archaeon]|nr:hypothetical protein [Candidatus Thermoplasmatota archaeon]
MTSTSVRAALSGIHARSEELVAATRDHDRRRIDDAALDRVRSRDVKALLALQKKLAIDPVTDGEFATQDIFRPFAESVPGLEVGSLTRYFDNNTFYKRPVVNGALAASKRPVVTTLAPRPKAVAWKAFLPSPYAFAKMCDDRHYGSSVELIAAFGEVLAKEAARIHAAGPSWIQLTDPAVSVLPPDREEWMALRRAVSRIVEAADGSTTVYHTQFGNAGPILRDLDDLPVDYVGVDLYETPLPELRAARLTRGLQAGIVDARSSLLETPDEIAETARNLAREAGVRELVLAPTCELEFLPRALADRKLSNLARAAAKVARQKAVAA